MFLSLSGQTPADKLSTVSLSETHRPVSNMHKLYWLGKLNELFSFFLINILINPPIRKLKCLVFGGVKTKF